MKILLFANMDWYLFNFRRSLVHALRDAGHELVLVSPEGSYGHKLRELGFDWRPAPMLRRSLNPLREALLVNWLRKLMVKERVDLVHSFTIKAAVYGSLAARLARVPARVNAVAGMGYVFTSNDLRALVLRPLVRSLMKFALDGRGTRLILQNPDDVRLFENSRIVRSESIRRIPGSGVDCNLFSPSPAGTAPRQGPLRVLLAARPLWDKGIQEFANAAHELRRAGRSIEFLLAGEPDAGNPAAVPQEALAGWQNSGTLKILGHVDDMPNLLRSVDVAVFPSYREGLPKGLIEAAACGIALITTDAPGCREVVNDMQDGLLVPARDSKALAEAIARLQDDEPLRRRLARAAHLRAREEFDERIVIRKTVSVYQELVGPDESSLRQAQLDGPVHR
jgi:glycosyltransferase involved in cell wall biosynthesis